MQLHQPTHLDKVPFQKLLRQWVSMYVVRLFTVNVKVLSTTYSAVHFEIIYLTVAEIAFLVRVLSSKEYL